MKNYALLQVQQLTSIAVDSNGNPRVDTLKPQNQYFATDPLAPWNQPGQSTDPADYPGILWTPPLIVELVKIPKPDPIPGKIAEPVLVWTETSCTRDWEIRDMTDDERAAAARRIWPNTQAFLSEFTVAEMAGIELSTDPTIAALRVMLSVWSGQIYSDDERVVTGLAALHLAGIISARRRMDITTK